MDTLPLPPLQSNNESEPERLIGEILLREAAPLIRHVIREQLGFFLNTSGANPNQPDAEDLYHDCLAKLIGRFRKQHLHLDQEAIHHLPQYVTRITINACHDYLREKFPVRTRLKHRLRDLLDRHQDFALWRDEKGAWVCCFHAWRNNRPSRASLDRLKQLEENPGGFKESVFRHENIRYLPLPRIVAEIFKWVKSPLELDQMVNILALLLEIRDYPAKSIETDREISERLIDRTPLCDAHLELHEAAQQLWEEIRQLPPKQRETICLSFTDENGEDLFSLLCQAEIVTLPELARGLDLPLSRLMALWKQMPMDNETLSSELNASRAQINKWRFLALAKLRKRTGALRIRG